MEKKELINEVCEKINKIKALLNNIYDSVKIDIEQILIKKGVKFTNEKLDIIDVYKLVKIKEKILIEQLESLSNIKYDLEHI